MLLLPAVAADAPVVKVAKPAQGDVVRYVAIPGSIHSPQSKGCHALIRQGAKLVETATDILEELAPQMEIDCTPHITAEVGDPDLDRMGHDPVTLDTLAWRSQQSVSQMAAQLLHWELQGWVANK